MIQPREGVGPSHHAPVAPPGRVNVVDGRAAFGAEYQASWPDAPQIRGSLIAQGQAGEGTARL